jgi:phage terminase large subunit-like protein
MPTIQIDVKPHPGQALVHSHPARFKVLACGRRWGKTRQGVNEAYDVAANGGRAWWVAPNYKMSEVGWRPLRRIGQKIGAEIRRVDRQILLPNGGEVVVRSADDPQSLRGEGLDLVVIDECAYVAEQAWTEALRPSLSDRQGSAIFISTPKRRNWFFRLFQQGLEDGGEWMAWQFPTAANPYIDPAEIEAARDHYSSCPPSCACPVVVDT